MRRYFAYIKESFDDRYPEGEIIVQDKGSSYTKKGEEAPIETLDVGSGEVKAHCVCIGLGFADFKDQEDFQGNAVDVVNKKMREVGVEA